MIGTYLREMLDDADTLARAVGHLFRWLDLRLLLRLLFALSAHLGLVLADSEIF